LQSEIYAGTGEKPATFRTGNTKGTTLAEPAKRTVRPLAKENSQSGVALCPALRRPWERMNTSLPCDGGKKTSILYRYQRRCKRPWGESESVTKGTSLLLDSGVISTKGKRSSAREKGRRTSELQGAPTFGTQGTHSLRGLPATDRGVCELREVVCLTVAT